MIYIVYKIMKATAQDFFVVFVNSTRSAKSETVHPKLQNNYQNMKVNTLMSVIHLSNFNQVNHSVVSSITGLSFCIYSAKMSTKLPVEAYLKNEIKAGIRTKMEKFYFASKCLLDKLDNFAKILQQKFATLWTLMIAFKGKIQWRARIWGYLSKNKLCAARAVILV